MLAFLAVVVVTIAEVTGQVATISPTGIYKALQGSENERKSAFRSLGIDGDLPIESVKLFAIQMDSDPELEQVLEVDTISSRLIRVYDNVDGGWREVGQVNLLPSSELSGITFHEVVEAKSNDLVLSAPGGGCGGGYCATGLSVWHLQAGQLVQVFATNESVDTVCFRESTSVMLPDAERSERGYLVVRTSRESMVPLAPICGKPERAMRTCSAYRWDAGKGSFVADPGNTARRCR